MNKSTISLVNDAASRCNYAFAFATDSCFSFLFQAKKLSEFDQLNDDQEVKFMNFMSGMYLLYVFHLDSFL